jgi:stress response protein YsnF
VDNLSEDDPMQEDHQGTGTPHQGTPDLELAGHVKLEDGESLTIPIVEETARIGKRTVETGRVRVSTRTETTEEVLRGTLRGTVVGVTRVPFDRAIASGEPIPVERVEDGVTIVPVLEEVLFVEKRLVLKEEIHIRRTDSSEDVEVPVSLRRQRANVERVDAAGVSTEIPSTETTP